MGGIVVIIVRINDAVAVISKWKQDEKVKILWCKNRKYFATFRTFVHCKENEFHCVKKFGETYEKISFRDMARKYPELWMELL